jgi:hypothetical protein
VTWPPIECLSFTDRMIPTRRNWPLLPERTLAVAKPWAMTVAHLGFGGNGALFRTVAPDSTVAASKRLLSNLSVTRACV